jgi:hypothetical protein
MVMHGTIQDGNGSTALRGSEAPNPKWPVLASTYQLCSVMAVKKPCIIACMQMQIKDRHDQNAQLVVHENAL